MFLSDAVRNLGPSIAKTNKDGLESSRWMAAITSRSRHALTMVSLDDIVSPIGETACQRKDMREDQVLVEIRDRLRAVLQDVPFAEVRRWPEPALSDGKRPDLLLDFRLGDSRWRVIVEVKAIGEPRQLRYAIQQLREYLKGADNGYGIIGAPYISKDGAKICRENGVGYVDLAGNCLVSFDQTYIERSGFASPSREKRPMKSPFTRRASRVLRVMLLDPNRSWQVQELAREADISLGLASKVKQRLLDLEYARENSKREISANRPKDILDTWVENYTFRKNPGWDFFTLEEPKTAERRLAEYCSKRRIRYAMTLFSGAALVAPYAQYTRGFSYLVSDVRKVAEAVGLKEVSSGPNFTILEPYDEGVFYGSRTIDGMQVVSDIQLYLDLAGYKGRGEEAAQFLLRQRIEPSWQS